MLFNTEKERNDFINDFSYKLITDKIPPSSIFHGDTCIFYKLNDEIGVKEVTQWDTEDPKEHRDNMFIRNKLWAKLHIMPPVHFKFDLWEGCISRYFFVMDVCKHIDWIVKYKKELKALKQKIRKYDIIYSDFLPNNMGIYKGKLVLLDCDDASCFEAKIY